MVRNEGKFVKSKNMNVQILHNQDLENSIGIGYTASKKIGNAVKRNKIKRKLKAFVQKLLKKKGAINKDYTYIVFGKSNAYALKQDMLLPIMKKGFSRIKN